MTGCQPPHVSSTAIIGQHLADVSSGGYRTISASALPPVAGRGSRRSLRLASCCYGKTPDPRHIRRERLLGNIKRAHRDLRTRKGSWEVRARMSQRLRLASYVEHVARSKIWLTVGCTLSIPHHQRANPTWYTCNTVHSAHQREQRHPPVAPLLPPETTCGIHT